MDHQRRPTVLIVTGTLLIGGLLMAASAAPPLAEMRWTSEAADAIGQMTRRPGECLNHPGGQGAALSVEIGRAAFRSPLILGGAAARAGLACDSCHRDGRDNRAFHFPGLSGASGTADVTSFRFSPRRGDLRDDPRLIPDLSGPKGQLKVAQTPDSGDLERFITGLVVEEFDGSPPPGRVIRGLADYVRALDPGACPGAEVVLTPAMILNDADRAVAAARQAVTLGDVPTALVMIGSARAALGRLDERYGALPASRQALGEADQQLRAAAEALRVGGPDGEARLASWRATEPQLRARLDQDAAQSLFNPAVLTAAVQ
jgi:hypothetical protein